MIPVDKEPEDEIDGVVAREVVPDEQHPEGWEFLGQGDADGESLLPALPAPSILFRWERVRIGQACLPLPE